MNKVPPLLSHQKQSIKFLKDRLNVFDMSDAGTGKTPVHITDFASRRRKDGGAALVLCPKSLISCAWGNDIRTFAPDTRSSLVYADNRRDGFDIDADFYVTNVDASTWLAEQPKKFFDRFDTLIIDESTAYKHGTSKRSKAAAKIRKHFEWVRLLSGTPTSNGITDLWHQMYLVDGGKLLGESFYAFRSACCIPEQKGNNAKAIEWTDKPGIEVVVGALIAPVVIRHKFEDCVDIPPNHQFAVPYELTKRHWKIYQELEADASILIKEKKITAVNGAVLYGKLLQCASGASYSDDDTDGNGDYALIDTGRYELVSDLIEQRRHSICFFNWKHQRDELIKHAKKEGWPYAIIDGSVTRKGEREKIVNEYQEGKYKVLFAHPKSAGHGLTLTRGTSTIFASPTPNLEFFLQAYKRIYRIGQTEKTETIMVIAQGTIDERVWASCQAKNMRQSSLLSYLE